MSHGAGVLLLASVAGYWVLERAEAHKGSLRRIGRLVGGFIIVVSLIGVACRVWTVVACYGPLKNAYCPFVSKGAPPSTQP